MANFLGRLPVAMFGAFVRRRRRGGLRAKSAGVVRSTGALLREATARRLTTRAVMMIRMLDRRQPSRAIRDARQVAAALSVSLQRFAGPGVGLAVAGLLCLLEGVVRPYGPDLSAQIARADASARGVTIWWAGWYGGTNVVGYSWLSGR